MQNYTEDYLLNRRVKIFQPVDGYRASADAVMLSAMVAEVGKGDKILDVGSGTGAVSLCLAERFKQKQISICGLELQPELAALANQSAAANDFDFLHYVQADIRRRLPSGIPNCSFQHVVTNPPYAEKDMPSPNAGKAAAHNLQDFTLTDWLRFCLKMTAPRGHLYIINRAEAIDEILSALYGKAGNIQLVPLFSKEGQKAKRILVAAQKDSKAPTVIHRGLTVHTPDSAYTPEAEAVLRSGKSIISLL